MTSSIHLLAADPTRAKLYASHYPYAQLTIIYDQVNFVVAGKHIRPGDAGALPATSARETLNAETEAFARSLCKLLRDRQQNGGITTLCMMAPAEFLAVIFQHLDQGCRNVLAGCISANPFLASEQDLFAHLVKIGTAVAAESDSGSQGM